MNWFLFFLQKQGSTQKEQVKGFWKAYFDSSYGVLQIQYNLLSCFLWSFSEDESFFFFFLCFDELASRSLSLSLCLSLSRSLSLSRCLSLSLSLSRFLSLWWCLSLSLVLSFSRSSSLLRLCDEEGDGPVCELWAMECVEWEECEEWQAVALTVAAAAWVMAVLAFSFSFCSRAISRLSSSWVGKKHGNNVWYDYWCRTPFSKIFIH